MKNNDERILNLIEAIKEKEELINDSERFTPFTNCMLNLEGKLYNINTLSMEELIILACKLSSFINGYKELSLKFRKVIKANDLIVSGFTYQQWIIDIENKIISKNIKNEKVKLKSMKSKLETMISEDKKIEIELDEMENFLK